MERNWLSAAVLARFVKRSARAVMVGEGPPLRRLSHAGPVSSTARGPGFTARCDGVLRRPMLAVPGSHRLAMMSENR